MSEQPTMRKCDHGVPKFMCDICKPVPALAAPAGSAKITQRQLETILINEGIIQAAAIEDPWGYDGGRTELSVTIATQQINELL